MLSTTERIMLHGYINRVESAYREFMGGATLPEMKIQPMSLEEMRQKLATAVVTYDPSIDEYTFQVFEQINNPTIASDCEYIIYHELTHAADIYRYGVRDQNRYNELRGYLEYHASQVELMKLLGASRFDQNVSFSMKDKIRDMNGELSVSDFVAKGIETTNESIARPGFNDSIAMIFHAVATLYNHLGRVSICQMFSTDYADSSDSVESTCPGVRLFGQEVWGCIEGVFKGLMSAAQIQLGGKLYYSSLVRLLQSRGIKG